MNSLIAFFVRQKLFGNLITFVVILIGFYAVSQVRRETFPNVKFDFINITTIFPGASPDEVERLVTNVIEQEIREVDGIKTVFSSSYEGLSTVSVQLDPDQTTSEKGKSDLQDVIDRLTDLPDASKKPTVTSLETKQQPIIEVYLSGMSDELKMRETAKFLEKEIESLPDVARVTYKGWRKLEYKVEADLSKLSRNRVSLEEISEALRRQNLSVPGGTLETSDLGTGTEQIVRAIGDFQNQTDIENTVVRGNDLGNTIRVKDLATVSYGLEKRVDYNAVDGVPSIRMTVVQKEKADTIRLVESLKSRIDSLRPQLPKDLKMTYMNDVSEFIVRRLDVLTGNLMLGLVLVLVILSLILPVRVAFLVSLGIPFAFLGTMIIFYNYDITLNLISLIGLIIVSGMLVDDAIVVTDNCVRLMEEGMDPEEAAIQGTQQIWPAVAASVLTTVVAFLPLMFMSGIFGKFVRQIPYGVILALIVSLMEAFFVLPGHIAAYIRVKKGGGSTTEAKTAFGQWLRTSQDRWNTSVVPAYERALRFLLPKRYWVGTFAFLMFVGSIVLSVKVMKIVLFPPDGIEIFTIQTETQSGTPILRHAEQLKKLETIVSKLPATELDHYSTLIGENRLDPLEPGFRRGGEYGMITVYLKPEKDRDRTAEEVIEALRKEVGTPPEFKEVIFGRVSGGPPVGKPVSLAVSGSTYPELLPAVADLKKTLSEMKGVRDIKDTYTLGKKEIQIRLKPEEAAAAGLSVLALGTSLRSAFEGNVATSIRTLDEEIDVRVQLNEAQRENQEKLAEILIPNSQGNLISLSRVADMKTDQGISVYDHKGYNRVILVTADVDTNVTSSVEVNGVIKSQFVEFQKKFPTVKIGFGGEDEDTQESLASLFRAFAVAFIAIFVILVMTFQNLLQPLLVMLTIPLGIVSVIMAFFTHGWPITFLGMMGVIALAGVIVNNAIVMVDFVNEKRRQGLDRFESIISGATTRLRPIFLTTITTVVGVMPTAYGIGGEDKFVTPLALALGWGLLFGSLLTAYVFPSAIAILDDVDLMFKKLGKKLTRT